VDARPASCLELELVCRGTRSLGCRQISHPRRSKYSGPKQVKHQAVLGYLQQHPYRSSHLEKLIPVIIVASPTVPTIKHVKTVVAPLARNIPYSLSSASVQVALVLVCGAWREEREVEDGGELIGEDKDAQGARRRRRGWGRLDRPTVHAEVEEAQRRAGGGPAGGTHPCSPTTSS
jgi:hypothetical protein